jgi:hypothetical protein
MAYAFTGTVLAPAASRAPSLIDRIVAAASDSRRRAAARALHARGWAVNESQLVLEDLPRASLAQRSRLPFAG